MQRGRIPIDLLPSQIDNLRCSQTVPIGYQNHGRISVAVAVVACHLDQLVNLSLGEVLAATKLAVWPVRAVFKSYVRFTLKSGHLQCTTSCPLWARSGLAYGALSILR